MRECANPGIASFTVSVHVWLCAKTVMSAYVAFSRFKKSAHGKLAWCAINIQAMTDTGTNEEVGAIIFNV